METKWLCNLRMAEIQHGTIIREEGRYYIYLGGGKRLTLDHYNRIEEVDNENRVDLLQLDIFEDEANNSVLNVARALSGDDRQALRSNKI